MVEKWLRLGIRLPNTGSFPEQPGLTRMAQAAEEAGADSLWVADHILMVDSAQSKYPYSVDGEPWWPLELPWYEAIVSCAHVAAVTSRCRVGPAVLILPQRNVLELAKATASIDRLSGGRLSLGVGLGWLAEETEALGYRFATRANRADDMIAVLRDCWTGRTRGHAGRELQVPPGLIFQPTPATPGGPPILVGGMSDPALRRAGAIGDGWLARGQPTGLDEAELSAGISAVQAHRRQSGRPGLPYNVMMVAPPGASPESLEDLIRKTAALGFDEFMFEPPWVDLDRAAEVISRARRLADRYPVAGT